MAKSTTTGPLSESTPEDQDKYTTAIMAGGKSSRMGTDKAFVPLLGKPAKAILHFYIRAEQGLLSRLVIGGVNIQQFQGAETAE